MSYLPLEYRVSYLMSFPLRWTVLSWRKLLHKSPISGKKPNRFFFSFSRQPLIAYSSLSRGVALWNFPHFGWLSQLMWSLCRSCLSNHIDNIS